MRPADVSHMLLLSIHQPACGARTSEGNYMKLMIPIYNSSAAGGLQPRCHSSLWIGAAQLRP